MFQDIYIRKNDFVAYVNKGCILLFEAISCKDTTQQCGCALINSVFKSRKGNGDRPISCSSSIGL